MPGMRCHRYQRASIHDDRGCVIMPFVGLKSTGAGGVGGSQRSHAVEPPWIGLAEAFILRIELLSGTVCLDARLRLSLMESRFAAALTLAVIAVDALHREAFRIRECLIGLESGLSS